MAILESNTDLDVKGRVLATTVPNSTGSIVTWNASTKVFGLRSNAQIISDLGLQSSLTAGSHINITSNSISAILSDGVWLEDSAGNRRIHVGSVSSTNDFLFRSRHTGFVEFKWQDAAGTSFMELNGTTLRVQGLGGTGSSIIQADSSGSIFRSGIDPSNIALQNGTYPNMNVGIATIATNAVKLQTARTINGTLFDGTANITTALWGTSRNITIGNTTKAVNGSSNVSWSLAEIGINTGNFVPYTGATNTVHLNDQRLRGVSSLDLVNNSMTYPNATISSPDAWNQVSKNYFSIWSGNNMLAIIGESTSNARRFGIQVGHSSASFATAPGTLELQPLHGDVSIGSLAGSGIRMVVANSGGILSTQALPTASDYITTNTNQTGLSGNKTTSGVWTYESINAVPLRIENTNTSNVSIRYGLNGNFWYAGLANQNVYAIGNASASLSSESNRLFWIDNNGKVFARNGFSKVGATDDDILLGNGGHRPVSDFALAGSLDNYVSKGAVANSSLSNNIIDLNAPPLGTYLAYTRSTSSNLPLSGGGYLTQHYFVSGSTDYLNQSWDSINFNRFFKRSDVNRPWVELWHSGNLLQSSIDNWNTAFSWGNHANLYTRWLNTTIGADITTPSTSRFNPDTTNPTNEHYAGITYGNNGNVTGQLFTHYQTGESYLRAYNTSWSNWRKIIDHINLDTQATALGFIKSSALPTVNNGALTLTTGTGLSGSANFTANQSGNSSFSVGIASTHKLPTVAEWNALPTTNTTYSAGTGLSLTGTTFGQTITTSGTGTFVTGITQTTNGFQINLGTPPNTNTTYTGSNGINVTGTVISPTYGTTAGTIAQGNDSRINNGQTAFGWGNHALAGYLTSTALNNYYQSGDVNIPAKGGDYVVFPKTGSGQLTNFDFNSITTTGFYNRLFNAGSASTYNAPKTGFYGFVEVSNHGGNLLQTTRPYRVTDGVWMRGRFSGTWTDWVEFIHSGNLASYANTLLTGFVPTSRTLTINGTTFDLSQNRTWNIPIPAQVNITQGTGIGITGVYPNLTITNTAPNATHTGDVTGSTALTIANNVVTFAKMQNIATQTFLGRATAGTGNIEALTVAQMQSILGFSTQTLGNSTSNLIVSNTVQRAALTGDVTASQNSNATTIANSAVTNAKMANMPANTFKGRLSTTGAPQDLTVAQMQSILGIGGGSGIESIRTDNSSSPGPAYLPDLYFNFHEYWGFPAAFAEETQPGNATAKASDEQLDFFASYDSVQTIVENSGTVDVDMKGYHIVNVLLQSAGGDAYIPDGTYAGDQINITTTPGNQINIYASNLITTAGNEVFSFANLVWDCDQTGWVLVAYGTP